MKGIMFQEPLFHLTVQGIKKQTRRIIKSRTGFFQVCSKNGVVTDIWQTDANEWVGDNLVPVKPRYKVGDIVYLKEPYALVGGYFEHELPTVVYKYGGNPANYKDVKWKNKLFMPESAARYFIKITAVRAERLQDISEEDCLLEGIERLSYDPDCLELGNVYYAPGIDSFWTAQEAYAALIDKINGASTWESNPRVYVYDYELTEN